MTSVFNKFTNVFVQVNESSEKLWGSLQDPVNQQYPIVQYSPDTEQNKRAQCSIIQQITEEFPRFKLENVISLTHEQLIIKNVLISKEKQIEDYKFIDYFKVFQVTKNRIFCL